MLKLFHAWGSCSLASLIALEEAGADYELVVMDTKAGDQRTAEYARINPKARVPALVTDQGVLTETPAILSYIPETHPAAGLLPIDAWERAQAHAFNSYLCSTVHVAHAHKHRGYRWTDDVAAQAAMTAAVPKNEIACFRLIEDKMFQGPWVLGEAFSVCDAYLFTLFGWLPGDGVDTEQFARLADHSRRVAERPAVRKVLAQQAA
ncbi:glutathione S-transferase family protein [Phenylobacterium sp.]|jgi:glutathione S-transferase|uniref:glutathione S-transferase family protein n=1 Tax=Phenylobacterium sp. TaxID=1871053 RepID=UPI002E30B08A|nr:glutathione S-transferase N-terminal domain-containing protein [Phenylobacterium sp.]HEX3365954.1 glutathione S-transferase N-terminal domain-containing protein [Phenylobacterium sp.]